MRPSSVSGSDGDSRRDRSPSAISWAVATIRSSGRVMTVAPRVSSSRAREIAANDPSSSTTSTRCSVASAPARDTNTSTDDPSASVEDPALAGVVAGVGHGPARLGDPGRHPQRLELGGQLRPVPDLLGQTSHQRDTGIQHLDQRVVEPVAQGEPHDEVQGDHQRDDHGDRHDQDPCAQGRGLDHGRST